MRCMIGGIRSQEQRLSQNSSTTSMSSALRPLRLRRPMHWRKLWRKIKRLKASPVAASEVDEEEGEVESEVEVWMWCGLMAKARPCHLLHRTPPNRLCRTVLEFLSTTKEKVHLRELWTNV